MQPSHPDVLLGELGPQGVRQRPLAERIRQHVEQLPGELGLAGRAGAVAQIEVEEVARGCVGQDQFGNELGCATWGAAHVITVECGVRADRRYRWYRIDGCSDTQSMLSSMT